MTAFSIQRTYRQTFYKTQHFDVPNSIVFFYWPLKTWNFLLNHISSVRVLGQPTITKQKKKFGTEQRHVKLLMTDATHTDAWRNVWQIWARRLHSTIYPIRMPKLSTRATRFRSKPSRSRILSVRWRLPILWHGPTSSNQRAASMHEFQKPNRRYAHRQEFYRIEPNSQSQVSYETKNQMRHGVIYLQRPICVLLLHCHRTEQTSVNNVPT